MPVQITLSDYINPNASVQLPAEVTAFLTACDADYLPNVRVPQNQAVRFDKPLYRSRHPKGNYQWNISENIIGFGSFGRAYASSYKIIIRNGVGYVVPTDEVIKIVTLDKKDPKREDLQDIAKEAFLQHRNGIYLHGLGRYENSVFIVMENRGKSLDEYLPLAEKYDFYKRIALIVGICNELQQYERTAIIHRDLKPENICLKGEPDKSFVVSGIDFGLAINSQDEKDIVPAGTLEYIAPETGEGKIPTFASDRWALGPIIGRLFNGEGILKARIRDIGKYNVGLISREQMALTPYSYDNIFKKIDIPGEIDDLLLADIKLLLNKLQATDPDERPSIDFITRFFTLIPQRARTAGYVAFKQRISTLIGQLNKVESLTLTLGLEPNLTISNLLSPVPVKLSMDNNNFVHRMIRNLEQELLNSFGDMPKAESHYAATTRIVNNNLPSADYKTPYPKWSIPAELTRKIEDHIELLQHLNKISQKLEKALTGEKFERSNSTGIRQIRTILANPEKTALEKIAALQTIGHTKTRFSVSNMLSRSKIFAKGRHKNVDTLYKQLASLQEIQDLDKLDKKLKEINSFIKEEAFLHKTRF